MTRAGTPNPCSKGAGPKPIIIIPSLKPIFAFGESKDAKKSGVGERMNNMGVANS